MGSSGRIITGADILDGTILTADVGDAQITTAKLTADAATQAGFAQTSGLAQEGTINNWFDMPGMSVPLTVTGGPILIWGAFAIVNTSAAQTILLASNVDNGSEQYQTEFVTHPSANNRVLVPYVARLTGVASGARTFRMRWRAAGGMMGVQERAMLVVELKK